MKKLLYPLLFVIALFPLLSCHAENKDEAVAYLAGTHYEVLPTPVRTTDLSKIEVAEFFWYGCPHCYHFEPSLAAWKKGLPKDVSFVRVPAIWHTDMESHAKMFYAAEQLGKLDELHDDFFTAMQLGKMKLVDKQEIAGLFAKRGVSEEAFSKAFDSFGVSAQVKQAQSKAGGSRISGTPELVVNGKYRISTRFASDHGAKMSLAEMLKVADFLVQKERDAKK